MSKGKDKLLEKWMKEHFPYSEFKKIGFFTKEMRGNYKAQAERVCWYFGFESVYEYGQKEIRCHISYVNPDCEVGIDPNGRPLRIYEDGKMREEPFVTVIPSVWGDSDPYPTPIHIDGSNYDEDDEEPDDGDADFPITNPPKKTT